LGGQITDMAVWEELKRDNGKRRVIMKKFRLYLLDKDDAKQRADQVTATEGHYHRSDLPKDC
jgi:hypothetical protein